MNTCDKHNIPAVIIRNYDAPCGKLLLGAFGEQLCLCDWLSGKSSESIYSRIRKELGVGFSHGNSDCLDNAAMQLDEYFAGKRHSFSIPLLLIGTEFQKSVWEKLLEIPYGSTESYGELARRLGRPKAVRAVANANGANPISIFTPCHRVIGSDGSLTGYGGGLPVKEYLLRLEAESVKDMK